jgi:hypothetical protein
MNNGKILGATSAMILPPGWNRVLVSLAFRLLLDMKKNKPQSNQQRSLEPNF